MFDNPGEQLKRLQERMEAVENGEEIIPEKNRPLSQRYVKQDEKKRTKKSKKSGKKDKKKDTGAGLAILLLVQLVLMTGVIAWVMLQR